MTDRPLGNLIDSLGVEYDVEEGELVEAAIILLKVIMADGTQMMVQRHSGIGWFERIGMLRQAELIESNPQGYSDCED